MRERSRRHGVTQHLWLTVEHRRFNVLVTVETRTITMEVDEVTNYLARRLITNIVQLPRQLGVMGFPVHAAIRYTDPRRSAGVPTRTFITQHGGVNVSWYRPAFEPNGEAVDELVRRILRLSELNLLVNDVVVDLHGP